MNDNLDILKQQWHQLAARTEALEEANRRMAENLSHSKTSSLQDRLASRITRTTYAGLVLPLLSPLLYYMLMMPWWVCTLYALFGLTMSIIYFMFAEYIRDERLTDMPVAAAIERASRIKVRQTQIRTGGMLTGFALVALLGFMVPEGPERETILIGGIIGFVIGLVFSIQRCIVNARIARDLVRSLRD